MPTKPTRAQKKQVKSRAKNVAKGTKYMKTAAKKLIKSSGKDVYGVSRRKQVKGETLAQEAKNFAAEGKKAIKSKGAMKPKPRRKLQVTKKSVAKADAKRNPALSTKYGSKKKKR